MFFHYMTAARRTHMTTATKTFDLQLQRLLRRNIIIGKRRFPARAWRTVENKCAFERPRTTVQLFNYTTSSGRTGEISEIWFDFSRDVESHRGVPTGNPLSKLTEAFGAVAVTRQSIFVVDGANSAHVLYLREDIVHATRRFKGLSSNEISHGVLCRSRFSVLRVRRSLVTWWSINVYDNRTTVYDHGAERAFTRRSARAIFETRGLLNSGSTDTWYTEAIRGFNPRSHEIVSV